MNLNAKHKAFADAYMKDPERNGRRAYKKIYPKVKDTSADELSSKLLKKIKVREYIQSIEKRLTDKVIITNEEIIQGLANIARFDIRKLYNEDGSTKRIIDLDDETALAIAGIDISTTQRLGDDKAIIEEVVKKIKIADKKGSYDSLAKIQGLFIEKLEVNVKKILVDI